LGVGLQKALILYGSNQLKQIAIRVHEIQLLFMAMSDPPKGIVPVSSACETGEAGGFEHLQVSAWCLSNTELTLALFCG